MFLFFSNRMGCLGSLLFSAAMTLLIRLLVLLSILGGMNACLLQGPRVLLAMSRDRLLPRWLSTVHPRYGTPYRITIATGVLVVRGVCDGEAVGCFGVDADAAATPRRSVRCRRRASS